MSKITECKSRILVSSQHQSLVEVWIFILVPTGPQSFTVTSARRTKAPTPRNPSPRPSRPAAGSNHFQSPNLKINPPQPAQPFTSHHPPKNTRNPCTHKLNCN